MDSGFRNFTGTRLMEDITLALCAVMSEDAVTILC